MESGKKYYKSIDIIRLLACLSVLLYHLNILKGGYLAVCTFFVLSSYLSWMSAFRQERFSIKKYYFNRLFKLYIPLLLVVLLSLFVISLLPNISWINLKNETKSVLLGYNNYWQITANNDYFTRQIDSPFMHFWYMAILLQFDLLFPFIFILLNKISKKVNTIIPCLISLLLAVLSFIYFYLIFLNKNITIAYYDTFARSFSLLFGLTLGMIHSYYKVLIPNNLKGRITSKLVFYVYFIALIILFIFGDASSLYLPIWMILVTIISCRMIDYSTLESSNELTIFDKLVTNITGISYYIYLFQYPVIYLFQYINIPNNLYLVEVILLIFILSYILNFSLHFKNKNFKFFRFLCCLTFISISFQGIYVYSHSIDYTLEMKELKKQLEQNVKLVEESEKNYQVQLKNEEEAWLEELNDIESAKAEISNTVANLSIVGIGDSVMLGAVPNLYKQFPNSYFDAKVSRFTWDASKVIKELDEKGKLGNPVVINLGANGDCSSSCKAGVMDSIGAREVYWVNTTNSISTNDNLTEFAKNYDNLKIIDWYSISREHSEYFYADKIHLTESGREAYTQAIYTAIYETYLDKYNQKRQEAIDAREEQLKNKLSFYGNDILLNAFKYIDKEYKDSKIVTNKDFDYVLLKSELLKSVKNNSLTNKVVFMFDSSFSLSDNEYQEILSICKDKKVYIISLDKDIENLYNNDSNVTFINLYEELKINDDYLLPDKIHLTDSGNKALITVLNKYLK